MTNLQDVQDTLGETVDQVKNNVENFGNDMKDKTQEILNSGMDKAQDLLNSVSFAPNIQVHISLVSYIIFKGQIIHLFLKLCSNQMNNFSNSG